MGRGRGRKDGVETASLVLGPPSPAIVSGTLGKARHALKGGRERGGHSPCPAAKGGWVGDGGLPSAQVVTRAPRRMPGKHRCPHFHLGIQTVAEDLGLNLRLRVCFPATKLECTRLRSWAYCHICLEPVALHPALCSQQK